MATARRLEVKPKVELVLTAEEAQWLKDALQNPIPGNPESPLMGNHRANIWNALRNAEDKVPQGLQNILGQGIPLQTLPQQKL